MSKYLVLGATGQQGGYVVKHLLAAGAKVIAVVRDPLSKASLQLQTQGVTLIQGSNDDFAIFGDAAKECKGVYLNLMPARDPESQPRQAKGIIKACKDAGIEIVVASTAFFTGSPESWDTEENAKEYLQPYYSSKAGIEKVVQESGLTYTILRPAFFHTNYLLPYSRYHFPGLSDRGELIHSLDPGVKISHIDVEDVGKFGAAALLDPETFGGHEIELGYENPTGEEAADIISRVSGVPVRVRSRTDDERTAARQTHPTQRFQIWANRADLTIDGPALESKYGISMISLEERLRREVDHLRESLPSK